MSIKSIKVSEEIAAGVEVSDTYTPANNEKLYIHTCTGESLFTINSVVYLVWDYGGNEEILWSTKGSSKMPYTVEKIGDGIKKIAIICSNGESGVAVMNGYCEFVT